MFTSMYFYSKTRLGAVPLNFFTLLILLQIFFLDNKDDWHTHSFLIRRTSSKRLPGSRRTGAWNENLEFRGILE